jgi:regulator of sigma E protease
MDVLIYKLLPFLAVMVVLVVVHEIGHFATAKAFGVKVLEFGLGYPPRLWGRRIGETEYTVNLLPLGGFVRLLGEEDPSDPRSLAARPAWQRIIVLSSGALMNVLLPVALFTLVYVIPQDVPVGRAVVVDVKPGSPAAEAGVRPGDLILAINGREVENTGDVSYLVHLYQGKTMTWTLRRSIASPTGRSAGSEIVTVRVYARWAAPPGQGPTGITLAPLVGNVPVRPQDPDESDEQYRERVLRAQRAQPVERRSYPIWEAVPKGVRSTAETLVLARNQIISWIAQRTAPQVAGPIGIAQVTGEVVKQAGWVALLQLAALLSINLAVLNLLPLPMLDGGRIMFVTVEILRGGKRVPPEKEALVHLAGFVVLLCLVVVISYWDILRIINGEGATR